MDNSHESLAALDPSGRLYNEDLASFDSKTMDQRDGEALCKAYGAQARMAYQIAKGS